MSAGPAPRDAPSLSVLVGSLEHMSDTATSTDEQPLERLEAEICQLAGQLAAATCRWLLLIADFDRRGGWAGWGVLSCAHWLSWKCGVSPRAAYEQLRVARALESLPVLTAGFAGGRLSYSKVRALTRIATPETEEDLVALRWPPRQPSWSGSCGATAGG